MDGVRVKTALQQRLNRIRMVQLNGLEKSS